MRHSDYTLEEPHNLLTNLRDMHELYCLCHLAEFAVAYHQLTASHELIDVVRRFVVLLHNTIIPKGGYPGHQELELALIRLYETTQDHLFLDTAGYFIRERGNAMHTGEHTLIVNAMPAVKTPRLIWTMALSAVQGTMPTCKPTFH